MQSNDLSVSFIFPYGVMVARNAVNVLVLVRVQVGEFEGCRLRNQGHLAYEPGNMGGSPVGVHFIPV